MNTVFVPGMGIGTARSPKVQKLVRAGHAGVLTKSYPKKEQLCKFTGIKDVYTLKKGSTASGMLWDTNMVIVSNYT